MGRAIPDRVEALIDEGTALVDRGGLKKRIDVALIAELAVGDCVTLHGGCAPTNRPGGDHQDPGAPSTSRCYQGSGCALGRLRVQTETVQ